MVPFAKCPEGSSFKSSAGNFVTVRRSTLPRCERRAGGSVFRRPLFGCQVGEMPYGFTARS